jgi:ribose transport system permease protein
MSIHEPGAAVETQAANTAPPATPPDPPMQSVLRKRLRRIVGTIPESTTLSVVLVALIVFFSLQSPYFLNRDNFINILIASTVVGIVSCTTTLLLIAGQFDLSIGGGTALVTAMFAQSFVNGNPLIVSILIALGTGLAIGLANGFLITVIGVNALITTIGTMSITRAFAYIVTNGSEKSFTGFTTLGLSRPFANIPWMVWFFVVTVILTALTLRFTTFGRKLYAIGANPAAARLAGIRTRRVIFVAFALSGLAVGMTGLLLASQTGLGSGNAATGLEFSAITAVILGGASLSGGRGTVFGTVLGVLIIGVVNDGIVLLNVESFYQDVVRGLLLIIAVAIDQLRIRMSDA